MWRTLLRTRPAITTATATAWRTSPLRGGQAAQRAAATNYRQMSARQYASYNRFNQSSSSSTNTPGYWLNLLYHRNTAYVGAGLVAFYIYNLDEAPFTHRRRCIWIPYWLETKIGDYSYNQILYQYQNNIVPANDAVYARISRIMNRLLTAAIDNNHNDKQRAHLESLAWTIHVVKVDAKEVPPNAFILPNGKIFIFSSILPICHDDDGLATVLSHELSHQLAHHTSEQLSKQPLYIALSTALYTLTGISWFNDLLIQGLLQMPASREMESEADHIGCELLARLCFNVESAVGFWERMAQYEANMSGQLRGSVLQEFLLSHPATGKRIHDIKAWLPELETIKESSGCYEHQWSRFKEAGNFFKRS